MKRMRVELEISEDRKFSHRNDARTRLVENWSYCPITNVKISKVFTSSFLRRPHIFIKYSQEQAIGYLEDLSLENTRTRDI